MTTTQDMQEIELPAMPAQHGTKPDIELHNMLVIAAACAHLVSHNIFMTS